MWRDGTPAPSPGLAIMLHRAGRPDEAQAIVERVLELAQRQFVSPFGLASYYTVAGETECALEWLERAYDARDAARCFLKVHPCLDPLRSVARFRGLLTRMRLD